MSEKEATEEQITDTLNKIILNNPDNTLRFLAKIVFNLRFDLDEFKIHVLEILKGLETEADPEPEELKFPPEIDLDIKRLKNDFYS